MSRKTLKLEEGPYAGEFLFRIPKTIDYLRVQQKLDILDVDERTGKVRTRGKGNIRLALYNLEVLNEMLCHLSIKPRLIMECPEVVPDGQVPVLEIPDEVLMTWHEELAGASGKGKEVIEEQLHPLPETGGTSERSPSSAENSESAPALS